MKKSLISIAKYLLGLGLGGTLLYLAFRGIDFDSLLHEVQNAHISWLLLAIGVGLLSHLARAARWRMQMIASGYAPSLLNTFAAVMVAYLVNLAVPRAGEVARCSVLLRSDKVPISTALGTVVVERVFDVIILALLILVVFSLEFERLYDGLVRFSSENAAPSAGIPMWMYVAAGFGMIVAVLALIFRKRLLQIPFFQRVYKFGEELIKSALSIRYLKSPGLFIFYTVVIWVCYILMTYVGFFSMDTLAGLDINLMYFALVITVVGGIGFALPSPGGVGSYHAAVVITFLGLQVLPTDPATRELGMAFATMLHTSQLVMMLVAGGIAYLYLWIQKPVDSAIRDSADSGSFHSPDAA